ncbi:MAG: coproporphyrinogen III oxidase family protein [Pseudomonadota bacterium]
MVVEKVMTAYLRRVYSRILSLDSFDDLTPPRPEEGAKYLLYVHIPFCEELCPYCSFNRFPFERELALQYLKGVEKEVSLYADLGFDFASLYVGGGTPTVLPAEMAELLHTLRSRFRIGQISLETNPNHLTDDIVATLKDAGVNRLSVGVQSFDDSLLQQMERLHKYGSGEEIRERLLKYAGTFDTLNVDMIFNFPTQNRSMLEKDLRIIRDMQADQVTFYPLMVSELTRKELAARFGPISYSQEKEFFGLIQDMLGDTYSNGTAWCFSRKNSMIDEYIVDYDEYIGVGSGSFGYVGGAVLANTFSVSDYLNAVNHGRLPLQGKRTFSRADRIRYDFTMKLFGESLKVDEAEEKFQGVFKRTLWKELTLLRLIGAYSEEKGVLRLTKSGRYLWVVMMREFFTGVNNFRDICRSRIGGDEKRRQ